MREKRSFNMTGFLTLMMIFVTVILVTVGALSIAYTGRSRDISDRSAEHIGSFYKAYSLSEERLSDVDGCIALAARSGAFDLTFEGYLSELDFAEYSYSGGKYIISCTTDIDGKTAVYWEISVDAEQTSPRGEYELLCRKTVSISEDTEEDKPLDVWDGSNW
ncbi:MAG: hypothetical protein ACI4JJ_08220 [Huintestinicola sp.]